MMGSPFLSIVIPVRNDKQTVCVAIDSVIGQRVAGVEVVVVDDGSTDGSADIIKSYGNQIVAVYQDNRGASSARNAGIRASRGRYLKFLDADDYLLPFSLASQSLHAANLPSRGISYGRILSWYEGSGIIRPHGRRDSHVDNQDSIDKLLMDAPVTASLIYPREVIDEIGGFDERVGLMDDFDLFARCIFMGCTVSAHRQPIYVYRRSDSGTRLSGSTKKSDYISIISMFKRHKIAIDSGACAYDKTLVSKGLARLIWIKGRTAARLGYFEEATCLFDMARQIHTDSTVGHPLYTLLARLIGPVKAEITAQRVKALKTAF